MTITADVQKLEPGNLVELFEIDATEIGGDIERFHGYQNEGEITWRGQVYKPWPIQADGFAQTGVGTQPSPTMRVGNVGGVISALCLALGDLVGAKITRIRTMAHYLDGQPSADTSQQLPPEIWIVEAKTQETSEVVEFELSSAISFDGMQLPGRQIIANMCTWAYRGAECGYVGSAMFDTDDNPVIDPVKDKCGKRVASCKKRFGEWAPLSFGGFPSADAVRGY